MGKLRKLFVRVRRTEPTCCDDCRRAARGQVTVEKPASKTADQ